MTTNHDFEKSSWCEPCCAIHYASCPLKQLEAENAALNERLALADEGFRVLRAFWSGRGSLGEWLKRRDEVLADWDASDKKATVPHVVKEGSREHVLSWSQNGERCSEPRCEINAKDHSSAIYRIVNR